MKVKAESRREIWAGILAGMLLLLVCVTGFWVYHRLSAITDPALNGQPRDTRLLMLKELNADLIRAENYVFAYALREEDSVASSFFKARHHAEFKMRQLHDLPSADSLYSRNIDTLDLIVRRRFETLEAMMVARNERRVNDAMQQVVKEVKSITKTKPVKRTEEPEAAPVQQEPEKKRLFRRKDKTENEPRPEVTQQPVAQGVSAAAINNSILGIKDDVVYKEQLRNALKYELEQRNNWLIARFTQLLQTIENREKKLLLKEARKAHRVAEETNQVIALFCVTSVLLIGLVAFLIVTLVRKVRATNLQLVVAKEKSDQLTASKSRFLANMSHELRTPLNAITGFADQLGQEKLAKEQLEKVDIIRKSAWHLARITNDILDLSKINSGAVKLEIVPVELNAEFFFVEQSVRELAVQKGNRLVLQLDPALPVFVLTDSLRLRQILINLLSNAVKFTVNGTVSLTAKLVAEEEDRCRIALEVADTGIGIAPEHLSRIFDEFEQAESDTTRKFGGTGLGLTITRNLVTLMGGTIRVESTPGQGTAFRIELPMQRTEAVSADRETDGSLEFLNGKRLLIVDDEAYNRKLLTGMLKNSGAIISEASDGNEAIEKASASDFDVLLLDLRMPGADGFEVMSALRRKPGFSVPVVALTAAISDEERMEMLGSGWAGVLLKPIRLSEIRECLLELLGPVENEECLKEIPEEEKDGPVDLDALRRLSGSDAAFYLDMLKTFERTAADGLRIINDAAGQRDWLRVAEAAHKMAPPVRHLHAMEAYTLLKHLETEGRAETTEDVVSDSVQKLNLKMETILACIGAEIERVECTQRI